MKLITVLSFSLWSFANARPRIFYRVPSDTDPVPVSTATATKVVQAALQGKVVPTATIPLGKNGNGHRELVDECVPRERQITFNSLEHGDYINELKGISIEGIPHFDGKCFAPENSVRVVNTSNPAKNCSPDEASMTFQSPEIKCQGGLRSGAPIIVDATEQIVPLAFCEKLGKGIYIQENDSKCAKPCASGGSILFRFGDKALVRSLNFFNVDEVTVKTMLNLPDGSTHYKTYKATFPKEAGGFQLEVGSLADKMSVEFNSGGVITEMNMAEPCATTAPPLVVNNTGTPSTTAAPQLPPIESEANDTEANETESEEKDRAFKRKCRNLIRQGMMEDDPLSVWKGSNQKLDMVNGGRRSKTALRSTGRSRTFHGPQQRIAKRFLECMVPGAKYEVQAWVKLVDPMNRKGVECETSDPTRATNVKKGNSICPTIHFQAEDAAGAMSQTWVREYRKGWKADKWNKVHAPYEFLPVGDQWEGNIEKFILRINQMNPDLELLVDNIKFVRVD